MKNFRFFEVPKQHFFIMTPSDNSVLILLGKITTRNPVVMCLERGLKFQIFYRINLGGFIITTHNTKLRLRTKISVAKTRAEIFLVENFGSHWLHNVPNFERLVQRSSQKILHVWRYST